CRTGVLVRRLRRFAHSHSGSQFLPHLPSHWYSDIVPPHCGQTRLRIDERMHTFNSPGGASMVIMFEVSPRSGEGQKRGQDDGGMPRGFCALCDAPNWLAAESVHASRVAPRSAWGKQSRCHRQSPNKSRERRWLRASQVLLAGPMAQQWACVPKFGRSLAHQELRRCSRPTLIRSPAKMGRYRCGKKANENGESYRPGPQNQQLNHQVNEGATILFGRWNAMKKSGKNACPHK